jgi:His/Glu/Gln/Arg/opine family amino acid ABC transporter permease subunit
MRDGLDLLGWFLPAFFKGLAVNFELALWVLLGGLPIGAVLAFLQLRPGWTARLTGWLVAVLRAVPTFVVMFFLVNVLPGDFSVLGISLTMSPKVAIVLALIIYMTAYVSDNGLDALRQLRMGSTVAALLFLMNLLRAFFVTVLSSSFGAALGVVEAVTITLRAIEAMPLVSDRLFLIGIVMLILTVCFQTIYQLTNLLRSKLMQRYARA